MAWTAAPTIISPSPLGSWSSSAGCGPPCGARPPPAKPNVYSFHELLLDNARHSVTVNGVPVDLTYKEYSLLRLLLENTNLVVTRETILQVVWGTDISVESRTVDMHIRTLRKKLGSAGSYILTVRKVGYKLADSEEGAEE